MRGKRFIFRYRADAPARLFDVTVHSGTVAQPTSYQFTLETTAESVETWVPVTLSWDQLLGVDWETDAGNPVNPVQITGVSIGFSTFPDTPNEGELWMDDLGWLDAETLLAEESLPAATALPEVVSPTETPAPARGCPGTIALGLFVFAGGIMKKTRQKGAAR